MKPATELCFALCYHGAREKRERYKKVRAFCWKLKRNLAVCCRRVTRGTRLSPAASPLPWSTSPRGLWPPPRRLTCPPDPVSTAAIPTPGVECPPAARPWRRRSTPTSSRRNPLCSLQVRHVFFCQPTAVHLRALCGLEQKPNKYLLLLACDTHRRFQNLWLHDWKISRSTAIWHKK